MTDATEPVPVGLTRFHVFTASDDLTTFVLVGTVSARDRDHALRVKFGKEPPLSVAVSEHAWKVRRPRIVPVVQGLEDVPMPEPCRTAAEDLLDLDDEGEPSGPASLALVDVVDEPDDAVPPVEDVTEMLGGS
jgi:hypothetical protein